MGKISSTVTGVWSSALATLQSQGLKAALVSLEQDVSSLLRKDCLSDVLCLLEKTLELCLSQSESQDHISSLRHTKTVLDTVQRCTSGNVHRLFRLQLLTDNSLASAYKANNALQPAYLTLLHAVDLVHRWKSPLRGSTLQYIASTLVNLSTIQLDLRLFPASITAAKHCLDLLHARLSQGKVTKQDSKAALTQSYAAALFNTAVAQEALGHSQEALAAYHHFLHFCAARQHCVETQTVSEAETAVKELRLSLLTPKHLVPNQISTPKLPKFLPKPEFAGFCDYKKYYSEQRLAELHKMLSNGSKTTFVSSSEYFGLLVQKELQLDTLRTNKNADVEGSQEKKEILQLRNKRHFRRNKAKMGTRGGDYFQERLNNLRNSLEISNKNSQQVAIRSQTPSSIPKPNFFLTALNYTGSVTDRARNKEEIEYFMSEIKADLKSLSVSPGRRATTPRFCRGSDLAKSMLQPREQPFRLTGLVSSMLGSSEKPRVITRRATVSFRRRETEEEGKVRTSVV